MRASQAPLAGSRAHAIHRDRTRLLELIKIRKEPGEGAPEHLGVLGEQLSTVQPQALAGHPCPGGEGRPPQSHEAPLTSFQEGTGGPLKRAVNPPESHL